MSRVVCGLRGLTEKESTQAIRPMCVKSFPEVWSDWQGKYRGTESSGFNAITHRLKDRPSPLGIGPTLGYMDRVTFIAPTTRLFFLKI